MRKELFQKFLETGVRDFPEGGDIALLRLDKCEAGGKSPLVFRSYATDKIGSMDALKSRLLEAAFCLVWKTVFVCQ